MLNIEAPSKSKMFRKFSIRNKKKDSMIGYHFPTKGGKYKTCRRSKGMQTLQKKEETNKILEYSCRCGLLFIYDYLSIFDLHNLLQP